VTLEPALVSKEPTPLDLALKEVITRLKPYGLTKGEVLMLLNLGVGLERESDNDLAAGEKGQADDYDDGDGRGGGDQDKYQTGSEEEEMEVDGHQKGDSIYEGGGGRDEGEGDDGEAGDDGGVVMMDAIVEQRSDRLSNDDVAAILSIIHEIFGSGQKA